MLIRNRTSVDDDFIGFFFNYSSLYDDEKNSFFESVERTIE
jgi:RPA family protein